MGSDFTLESVTGMEYSGEAIEQTIVIAAEQLGFRSIKNKAIDAFVTTNGVWKVVVLLYTATCFLPSPK